MNNIPWVMKYKENYRVEVTQKYCENRDDCSKLASELSDLFDAHKEWNDTQAVVGYDEVYRCIFCGEIYEPMYLPENEENVCANCGKGKLEFAVKKMSESGEVKDA
jgi:DNA-directed RNA polymerase subunit RPC12/RpoP